MAAAASAAVSVRDLVARYPVLHRLTSQHPRAFEEVRRFLGERMKNATPLSAAYTTTTTANGSSNTHVVAGAAADHHLRELNRLGNMVENFQRVVTVSNDAAYGKQLLPLTYT